MSEINFLNEILLNQSAALVVLDKDLKIIYLNNEVLKITGLNENELLDKDISALKIKSVSDTDCFLECLKQKKEVNNLFLMDFFNAKKYFINAKPFFYENNDYMIITLFDNSKIISCNIENTSRSEKIRFLEQKIIGKDKSTLELYNSIILASESLANVLITGESGTGKELVAKAIHEISERRSMSFITVNCSSLSETLLESELFGHVKGSFTGAYKDKIGKFEASEGGTIFLDEIGDISPLIQLKLLRVIQEKTITRVGDNKEIKVDMRIICATNKNLRELIKKGEFREDLFYRLNVFQINAVSLRERENDISVLAEYFVNKYNSSTGKKIIGFTEDSMRLLMDYCWPGNIRELENAVEHAFVVCKVQHIDIFDLPLEIRQIAFREGICKDVKVKYKNIEMPGENKSAENKKKKRRNIIGKNELTELLQKNEWNKTETARILGISRVALWKKINKFKIESYR